MIERLIERARIGRAAVAANQTAFWEGAAMLAFAFVAGFGMVAL